MYGRHPRLPVDLLFGLSSAKEPCEYSEYVQTLRECLTYAYGEPDKMSRHAKDLQKKHYDKKVKSSALEPGDRVMVKLCFVEGKHKLANRRWRQGKSHPPQSSGPVYVFPGGFQAPSWRRV